MRMEKKKCSKCTEKAHSIAILSCCIIILFASFVDLAGDFDNAKKSAKLSEQTVLMLMEKSLKKNIDLVNSNSEIVTVSFYCPVLGGINGNVGISASGAKLRDGWSVAISRDLLDEGWYGMKIDLYGENLPLRFRGVHFSSDKMAKTNPYTKEAITKHIDIFVSDPSMIPKEGVFRNVKVSRIIKYDK